MSYQDLLRALREEAEAEIARIREDGRRAVGAVLDEARAEAEAERARALDAARAEIAAEARHAAERAADAAARAELVEQQRLLGELRARAAARLPSLGAAPALFDEIAPELPEGPLTVRVAPAEAAALRAHLTQAHQNLLTRAALVEDPAVVAGVTVEAGRLVLDNSLPARLARLWPRAASELARALFRGGDGAL